MTGTIGLDALAALPDLQTRTDRKYLVPPDVADDVLATAGREALRLVVDGRDAFTYESVYLDTPDDATYLAAAHGRRRRYKVRTRAYLEQGLCTAEVKVVGGRGETVKHRRVVPFAARGTAGPQLLDLVGDVLGHVPDLRPVLRVTYVRRTWVVPDDGSRVTRDDALTWEAPDGRRAAPRGVVVLETKSPLRAGAVDRAMWRAGHRPTRISKYAVGRAALDLDLPANRWARTLRTLAACTAVDGVPVA